MGDELMKILPPETQQLIRQLAHERPTLSDLSPEQTEALAKAVLGDYLKDEMRRAVLSERISFSAEMAKFLDSQNSPHTRRAYKSALTDFGSWLAHKDLKLADVTPAKADDYVRDQRSLDLDGDSVRLRVAAISSFFTFLERIYHEIRNPFRGTKTRPKGTQVVALIPTASEIEVVLSHASPKIRAVVAIISETGLRIGALAELRIKPDGSFHTLSKGKRFQGFEPLSAETLRLLENAKLSLFRPFNPEDHKGRKGNAGSVSLLTASLTTMVSRHCIRLRKEELISEAFSPHDFRHAFAEAHAHRGLVWLRDRLGHASISVTERYLRNTLGRNTTGL